MSFEFSIPIRVYIEDTDAGGIVYYVNYLKFMERARSEFMRSLGYQQELNLQSESQFVVCSADAKFLKSAMMDMEVISALTIKKVARTYIIFDQNILDDSGVVYCHAEIKIACIRKEDNKPLVLPDLVSAKLKTMVKS